MLQFLIMFFYYGAQLGIALSVVDSKDCYRAEQLLLKKQAATSDETAAQLMTSHGTESCHFVGNQLKIE